MVTGRVALAETEGVGGEDGEEEGEEEVQDEGLVVAGECGGARSGEAPSGRTC